MALTYSDIDWCHQAYYDVEIIDNCCSFPNVPLLGTKRVINYNHVLTCSQLGYQMRDKPNNIHLSGFFLKEGEDPKWLRKRLKSLGVIFIRRLETIWDQEEMFL